MSQQFRLPSGGYTASVNRYLREWKKLAGAIEEKLGVKVYAFDPDVAVSLPDGGGACSLPLWLVRRIAGVGREAVSDHQPQCMTNYFAHAECDCRAGEIERLRAELAASREREARMQWQPIETAPTDGTRILLCGRDGKIADGHYGQPDGFANPKRFVWPYIHANPTHWMPLQAPPAALAEGAQE